MQIAVLGIDLGKNSCSVVGLDASGRVVLRRRLHRDGVDQAGGGAAELRGGDGGLLRRASPRPQCCATRATRSG